MYIFFIYNNIHIIFEKRMWGEWIVQHLISNLLEPHASLPVTFPVDAQPARTLVLPVRLSTIAELP